ncbi:hypothetical protein J2W21_003608 [Sinomonas atrocyanea]|uniref:hypothetical protein n=1 Tax=Sinomonas atrocyanea TaxID=37927 RepID=UPI002780C994|nr:hypothetical protein [Sinomonas atrocyanea]MDP9886083.1 hypothetical protein [Sinomonas atrocyanea]
MDRNLLDGPSAYMLTRVGNWSAVISGASWIVLVLLMAFSAPESITGGFLAIGLFSAAVWCMFVIWARAKAAAERRAAYTTLSRRFTELEQRDPYLGTLIRAADDEYLAKPEFAVLLKHSRAQARFVASALRAIGPASSSTAHQPYWTPARWLALSLISVPVSAWGGEQLTPTGATWYSDSPWGWNPMTILVVWSTGEVPVPRASIAILCFLAATSVVILCIRRARRLDRPRL